MQILRARFFLKFCLFSDTNIIFTFASASNKTNSKSEFKRLLGWPFAHLVFNGQLELI